MTREILFKAKRKNWRELPKEEWWVEGYYCKWEQIRRPLCVVEEKEVDCIITWMSDGGMSRYEIDPETLCQYIGLKDKNGQKIWENDICEIHSSNIDEEDGYFTTAWDKDEAKYVLDGDTLIVDFDNIYGYECEVIGNVFDNPELLGGAE